MIVASIAEPQHFESLRPHLRTRGHLVVACSLGAHSEVFVHVASHQENIFEQGHPEYDLI